MTYTARCDHGELWAVCRQCSTFDPRYVDEEPWDLTEGATHATGLWLTAFVVVLAAFVAVLTLWRITRD